MGETFAQRYRSDGALDPAFGGEVSVTLPPDFRGSAAAAAQPDGTLLLGGQVLPLANSQGRLAVARLLPDGQPDPSSSGEVVAIADIATLSRNAVAMDVLPDGHVVVGTTSDERLMGIARLHPDGLRDTTLADEGVIGAGTYGTSRFEDLAVAGRRQLCRCLV